LEVQREGSMLEKRYFLKLLQFIGEQTRSRTKGQREKITEVRRKHYVEQNWEEYEKEVRKALELEDKAAQAILSSVTEQL